MRKILLIIGIAILLLLLTGGGLILMNKKKLVRFIVPELKQVNEIDILLKGDQAYINSKLTVKNNSFFTLAIDSIKYTIKLMDKEYIHNEKYLGLKLKRAQMDTIDFSLKLPINEIIQDLKRERQKGDSTDYTINVALVYSTFFGEAVLPYKKSAKLKIPQPPEIELVHIHYKKVELKHFQADINIKITNYNKLDMTIKELKYDLDISNRGKVTGSYYQTIHISPNSSTNVTLPVEVDLKHIAQTLLDVLLNEDNYNYTLKINALVESPDPGKEPTHINLVKEGKMELKK